MLATSRKSVSDICLTNATSDGSCQQVKFTEQYAVKEGEKGDPKETNQEV